MQLVTSRKTFFEATGMAEHNLKWVGRGRGAWKIRNIYYLSERQEGCVCGGGGCHKKINK